MKAEKTLSGAEKITVDVINPQSEQWREATEALLRTTTCAKCFRHL